jgi:hypothetical protein
VHSDIRFEANISEYEANKTDYICLFCIQANKRNLHAKRIKTEANIPLQANILLTLHQSKYLEAK